MKNTEKQPIKMTPGDDLHLTMLMAPYSLNFCTGKDRDHLLAYGRAAFEAGKSGQCLHQIQEPAVAVPDEAEHSITDEMIVLAWNAMRPSHRLRSIEAHEAAEMKAAISAALAATPAADAPAWDGKLPERLQRALNELRIDCKTAAVSSLEFEVRSAFEGMHTSLATVKRLNHAAQKRLDSVDAAQPDPFAAAAPVVLPEPAAIALSKRESATKGTVEFTWGMDAFKIAGPHALYTEQQVRALLATGGQAQAVPVAVTTAEELEKLNGENVGSKMASVFHPSASGFPVKLYAEPQQADARDAGNEWQEISTMPTCDDLIWLYCQENNTVDGPIAPDPSFEEMGWTHWAYANAPSTAVIDRAAIAAAKGE